MSSKIADLPRFDTGNLRHNAWNRLQILNNLVESGRRNVADTYLKSFSKTQQEDMAEILIRIGDSNYETVHREIVNTIH